MTYLGARVEIGKRVGGYIDKLVGNINYDTKVGHCLWCLGSWVFRCLIEGSVVGESRSQPGGRYLYVFRLYRLKS